MKKAKPTMSIGIAVSYGGSSKKRIQNRDDAHIWLNGYSDDRGRHQKGWKELHPQSRLEDDVRDQWTKGNQGTEGEWK